MISLNIHIHYIRLRLNLRSFGYVWSTDPACGGLEAQQELGEDTRCTTTSHAPQRIQTAMAAYLDGINRFIAEDKKPLEYQLLGADPKPFDTRDVYCATGFMAFSFAIHLKTEPILDWMNEALGPTYMADLATGPEGFTRIPVTGAGTDSTAAPSTEQVRPKTESPTPSDISAISTKVHRLDAPKPSADWSTKL